MLGKLLTPIATTLVIAAAALIVAAPPHGTSAAAPLDAEEQAFLTLINSFRQQNAQAALTVDAKLQEASEWMSQDLGTNNYFSHTDSLGRDPFVRMSAFGYNYNTWKGENLAAGTSSAQTAFNLWHDSPGHNSNMLGSNYVAIGIARVYTAGSQYSWYWTADFGGFLSSPLPPKSSATPTPTPAPTATPTPAATAAPTLAPTSTNASAPSPTPTATSTPVPTAPPTPAPTATPTSALSPTPTATSTPGATATPTLAETPSLAKGDVDCSGTITSRDALVELRYVAQLYVSQHTRCSGDPSFLEDVDCNDHVTAVDALKILRYVALLPVGQSEPCPDIGIAGS